MVIIVSLILYPLKNLNFKLFRKDYSFSWSSVKEFSCPKAIDFAPEADLKFWSIYRN